MIILRCITILLNSVSGKVSDMKEVAFMSNFHLIKKDSVKQCILKFFDPKQNSVPSRSVFNKAVSHKVLLYIEQMSIPSTDVP